MEWDHKTLAVVYDMLEADRGLSRIFKRARTIWRRVGARYARDYFARNECAEAVVCLRCAVAIDPFARSHLLVLTEEQWDVAQEAKWTNGGSGQASSSSSAPPVPRASCRRPLLGPDAAAQAQVPGRGAPARTCVQRLESHNGEAPHAVAHAGAGACARERAALHSGMQMQTQKLSPSLAMIMSPRHPQLAPPAIRQPMYSTAVPVTVPDIATTQLSIPSNDTAAVQDEG
ncbi:hypothetical protein FA95DRAFT_1613431 [Auriscalpium vulgare]|uniref:Uncharacterized protein n=1 Tax=Auriscalpium vulgare TaxID=40419 RepID=A0ACB8R3J9_9AGAM|nr:hypothetical protein FA95DRAFT_1613431 [Auriscalpium vulgare]